MSQREIPILLVHGAWHGGWCWQSVRKELTRLRSCQVLTPTLTGLGERSHLLSPWVGLETHILDILQIVEYEDLHDVVLVGHSYGGAVITGVCDRAKSRVRHALYLDALIPEDGEAAYPAAVLMRPSERGEGMFRTKVIEPPDPAALGIERDRTELIQWTASRLTPHPSNSVTDPIHLLSGGSSGIRRTYVRCSGDDRLPPHLRSRLKAIQKDATWKLVTRAAPHAVMLSDPAWTARTILGCIEEAA